MTRAWVKKLVNETFNRNFDFHNNSVFINLKRTCYFDDGQTDELILTKMIKRYVRND